LPDAEQPLDCIPYITRQTVAYALSLVVFCVCYSVTDTMTKGRAPALYEKKYDDFSRFDDKEFYDLLSSTRLISWLYGMTTAESEPDADVNVNADTAVAEPERNLRKSAAAGTRDEDWLLVLDEAKLRDDVAAVAEAEHRKSSGVQRLGGRRPSAAAPAAGGRVFSYYSGIILPIPITCITSLKCHRSSIHIVLMCRKCGLLCAYTQDNRIVLAKNPRRHVGALSEP
jgi:hypothetical protein